MRNKKIMFGSVVAAALFTVGVYSVVFGFTSGKKGFRALEGTWIVRLTPASGSPQFDELMTFDSGGGIVESNNFPFVNLGLSAGTGHGTYSHQGPHTYPFSFAKFLFTPTGVPAGTLKVTGQIFYDPSTDTWSGPGSVEICDNQINNCFQIDVTEGRASRVGSHDQ